MPPKKPNQGDRIADLEAKLELVFKKLEIEVPLPEVIEKEDGTEEPAPPEKEKNPPIATPKERKSRSRTRESVVSVTMDDEDEYTPQNRRGKPDRTRSYTPVRPRKMHSTRDVLHDTGTSSRAQQILDLLNPQLASGKVFDPYSNKTARYSMPRMFLNLTAQKIVKQYKNPDDLTLPQFLEGFSRMIEIEPSEREKKLMLAHLIDVSILMQDFSWEVVREWTNSVISSVGQGEYRWADNQAIEKEKIVKLMGASAAGRTGTYQGKNACVAYNATKCPELDSHGMDNLHICNFCMTVFGADHDHPVVACHKRTTYRKNKDRSDYQRPDRHERFDRQESNYQVRPYDAQYNQAKGRGSSNYYRQQNTYQQNQWSQPPPNFPIETKNWQI